MNRRAYGRDLRPQFRLRSGQDDVLIAWILSIEPRRRSDAIRLVLERHVAGLGKVDSHSEDPDLAAALDALF